MIYHVVTPEIYEAVKGDDEYKTPTMEWEGFIHCLRKDQLLKVANDNYLGAKKIILLCIDETKLTSQIVEEDLYGMNESFFHIYGPVNKEAITRVIEWVPGEQGYALPDGL